MRLTEKTIEEILDGKRKTLRIGKRSYSIELVPEEQRVILTTEGGLVVDSLVSVDSKLFVYGDRAYKKAWFVAGEIETELIKRLIDFDLESRDTRRTILPKTFLKAILEGKKKVIRIDDCIYNIHLFPEEKRVVLMIGDKEYTKADSADYKTDKYWENDGFYMHVVNIAKDIADAMGK